MASAKSPFSIRKIVVLLTPIASPNSFWVIFLRRRIKWTRSPKFINLPHVDFRHSTSGYSAYAMSILKVKFFVKYGCFFLDSQDASWYIFYCKQLKYIGNKNGVRPSPDKHSRTPQCQPLYARN